MVISLFFLWLISPQHQFIASFDIIPVGMSVTILFLVSYIYMAQCFRKRDIGIFFSILSGYGIWILFIIALYFLGSPSLLPSFFIYLFVCSFCQWALFQLPPQPDKTHSHTPFTKEIIARIVISGGIVSLSLLIAKAAGPFWGTLIGVTFPALYTSYLTLLHYAHGPRFLINVFRLMPTGSTTYIFYAFIVREMYPLFGPWMGTMVAYAMTVVYIYMLSKMTIAAQDAFYTRSLPIFKAMQKRQC